MLGSVAEAEDAVHEAYLRWHDADRDGVCDARAFLMTTTTRICVDVLKSARARGGKVPAALNVIEGADRVAAFAAGVVAHRSRRSRRSPCVVQLGTPSAVRGAVH